MIRIIDHNHRICAQKGVNGMKVKKRCVFLKIAADFFPNMKNSPFKNRLSVIQQICNKARPPSKLSIFKGKTELIP